MANLSPWFDHIQAARKALDLADTWLASKEMEVLDSFAVEEELVIDDKDLDQTNAVKLSRQKLLVKFDEYRQRLEDPLKVGQVRLGCYHRLCLIAASPRHWPTSFTPPSDWWTFPVKPPTRN